MKRNILNRAVCVYISMLLGLTACMDDEIRPFDDIPEGETIIDARVNFKTLTPALATRAVAGDAIEKIDKTTLWVLAYDTKGEGELKYVFTGDDLLNYQSVDAKYETPVKFQLKIPYGVYRMYAVANVNLNDAKYQEAIKTVKGLKGIAFQWNESDVAKNNQMFGYFTPEGKDSEMIRIDRRGMTFQARVRRLASKVTVAFDGSMLHDGVYVYIKSAKIKDIPASCFLGDTNRVTSKADLITDGDTIQYAAAGIPYNEDYPVRITKGRAYYPCNEAYEKNFHSETERALFFYENMQGKSEGEDSKKQNSEDMGKKEEGQLGYKDNKPYGTYIEVEAYYISKDPDKMGMGEIVYRFMLGKDAKTDFNAERNHHYKLTLKFKNYANDVDWHIEYEEKKPEMFVPDVYYISPLYNHSMMLPIKVNTGDYKLLKLEAKIKINSWAPWEAALDDYYNQVDPYLHPGTLKNYTGFLSLTKSTDRVFEGPRVAEYHHNNTKMDEDLENYYKEKSQGARVYYDGAVTEGESGSDEQGTYIAKKGEEGVWNFQLPMYTRAKQLIIASGYTGCNPYEMYRRRSEVEFMATLKAPDGSDTTISNSCPVMQERRMVNPTGVWRKHDNAASFHVVLKCLNASAAGFIPFTSEGKWRAYRLKGGDPNVSVSGNNMSQDTVVGSTGSNIDFNINFSGTIGEKENRFAIIQVDYHDYSCQHLIFVRQGDEPVAMVNGGRRWYTWNMRTKSEFATSPCEEGSMFRWASDLPIDATMSAYSPEHDVFPTHAGTTFTIAGGGAKKWDDIVRGRSSYKTQKYIGHDGVERSYYNNLAEDFIVAGSNIRVAEYSDFFALYDEANGLDNGYGVLYGNEDTETADDAAGAYGYNYTNQKGGMRGCFVYDIRNGKHIFFPIGASGYGRRQDQSGDGRAVLRYGGWYKKFDRPNTPLMNFSYNRKGAIYWLRTCVKDTHKRKTHVSGWDFNYFSFDFNMIEDSEWGNCVVNDKNNPKTITKRAMDAAFVRCVRTD